MFSKYLYEKSSAEYSNRVLLVDLDDLEARTDFCGYFQAQGFSIIRYADDLQFRVQFNDVISSDAGKFLMLVKGDSYIPYDVLRRFHYFAASLAELFPKLNTAAVKEAESVDFDLLHLAYCHVFDNLDYKATKQFITERVYSKNNVKEYLQFKLTELTEAAAAARDYKDWFKVANLKALIDKTATEFDLCFNTDVVQARFVEYINSNYGKLSSVIDRESPVLVSRAMEYMHDNSEKFAVIVMDGMSEFDWQIISRSFKNIHYKKTDAFAMIPTTTSISRQCLLSNKYPSQLVEPWRQSKEKYEFMECAKDLGYAQEQIEYARGYDVDFGVSVKCAAVIINDVDDMVHGQKQSRTGMFNDITVLSKEGELVRLTQRLLQHGFDVYITADHGNAPCIGMGRLMNTGVETETKSRRMLVLKDFADKQALIERYALIEFPKYYLNKGFDYLICSPGSSFDAKDDKVMSHGGITVDEVVVPFIQIKAVENNG